MQGEAHLQRVRHGQPVAGCGLQLYRFGQAVSICFFTRTWRPDSFYDRIKENADLGLHTLLLLDIRVKEPSVEALCRGEEGVRAAAVHELRPCAGRCWRWRTRGGEKVYGPDSMCVAVARMGQDDGLIRRARSRRCAAASAYGRAAALHGAGGRDAPAGERHAGDAQGKG